MSKLKDVGTATQNVMEGLIQPMVGRRELAEAVGYVTNAGYPTSVVPNHIGEHLFDTTNSIWYKAYATTAGSWRQADASGRMVAAGATLTATKALHDGSLILLDTAAGSIVTLPAASGAGTRLKFAVSVTATSNSHIVKVANASDTLSGFVYNNDMDGTAPGFYKASGTDDTVTLNRTTTGGVIGDTLEFVDFKTNVWLVSGNITCVAGSNIATPFSATV